MCLCLPTDPLFVIKIGHLSFMKSVIMSEFLWILSEPAGELPPDNQITDWITNRPTDSLCRAEKCVNTRYLWLRPRLKNKLMLLRKLRSKPLPFHSYVWLQNINRLPFLHLIFNYSWLNKRQPTDWNSIRYQLNAALTNLSIKINCTVTCPYFPQTRPNIPHHKNKHLLDVVVWIVRKC